MANVYQFPIREVREKTNLIRIIRDILTHEFNADKEMQAVILQRMDGFIDLTITTFVTFSISNDQFQKAIEFQQQLQAFVNQCLFDRIILEAELFLSKKI